ncbi:uncharacterized protein LOC129790453 [Lutzomyia longipalpis]|uniref:uncharacterized protein LOC129790453 n=1 Tax=Lutzomyia longipalpis TaxID=7200 RepID=UPI0024846FBA|nr:uncharacterized protein LOC129790453 [Lutzomyia longipalpis]
MIRALVFALLIVLAAGSPVSRDAVESSSPSTGSVMPQKPEAVENPSMEIPKPMEEPQKPEDEKPQEEMEPSELSPPPLPQLPQLPQRPTLNERRRVVFYDQRQSGKYNIRADLDNFMILVIPSSPSTSSSLLDFLTQGTMRRSQLKHPSKKKGTKIHKLNVVKNDAAESDHAVEISGDRPKISQIHTIPQHPAVDHFIEGRTPYKVDISSTARTDPEARIDLLPAKTPVLRIIRPEESRSGNSYRPWAFPGATSSSITFRNAKSLPTSATDQLNIATNSVATSLFPTLATGSHFPSDSDQDEDLDTRNSFDSLNVGNVDAFGVPEKQYNEDWEWKLLGAEEQCGPDRKRDSYGICQFVPT